MTYIFRWCYRCSWLCARAPTDVEPLFGKEKRISASPVWAFTCFRRRRGWRAKSETDAVGIRETLEKMPFTPDHWRGWVRSWLRQPPPCSSADDATMTTTRRGGRRVSAETVCYITGVNLCRGHSGGRLVSWLGEVIWLAVLGAAQNHHNGSGNSPQQLH